MSKDKDVAAWMSETVRKVRESVEPDKTATAVEFVMPWAAVAIGLWKLFPGERVGDVVVTKFIVKGDNRDAKRAMLVVTGTLKRKKVITFHSGPAGADLFRTFLARVDAGALTWKEDTPFSNGGEEPSVSPLEALPGL